MATGTVKAVTDRGFGFIKDDESEKDIFFHERNLPSDLALRKLRVGDRVKFTVKDTDRGPNAVDITLE